MKTASRRTLDPQTLSETQAMIATHRDIHDAIAFMRTRRFSKIDCIKTLREVAGISLHDGKNLVHLSPAWADRYTADEAFHDAAEKAVKIAFREESTAA